MIVDVFNFHNYVVSDQGLIMNKKTGKILTPISKNGYLHIRLSDGKKIWCKSLHRLVYESFKGKIKDGFQINHINGIKHDNSLDNLEEVTPRVNTEKMLFLKKGEFVNTAKLKPEQIMEIRLAKSKGVNSNILSKKYSISKSTINRIARGITWKHLPILDVDNSVWGNPSLTGAMSKETLESKYGKNYFKEIARSKKFKRHCPTCTCCKI